jgi:DNA processing protein
MGHPTPTWLEAAVTLSQLRNTSDTLVARLFKELSANAPWSPSDRDWPERVADAAIHEAHRASHLARARRRAADILACGHRHGLTALTSRDAGYPPLLTHIADPPIVLWARGDCQWLGPSAVAIVGSRSATPAAVTLARRLGAELADAGLVVVSGLARGVDAAAHEGALTVGATIAVLGCGADVVYPREHQQLAGRIAKAGLILSEFAPGTPPRPRHFPLRNRIISGLSLAVVVVEASDRSGSLITARMALEQGRDVLAVPGNVLSGRSRGCHALIRDGARLVESAADVIEQIQWTRNRPTKMSRGTNSLQLNELEETMAVGEAYTVDALAAATGRPAADLLSQLGALELAGRLTRIAGGQYVRLD